MKILCIGQSAYDITIPVSSYPEENKKYKINMVYECGGGSANNSAYLLAMWHNDVYLASPIGKDIYGEKIKDELVNVGVNIDYFEEKENVKTTTSYVINNQINGTRTIITNRSSDMQFSQDFEIKVKPDVILMDGNNLEMSLKVIRDNPDAIKIIDAGSMKEEIVELSKYCDYIVCSNDFAREYSNINFDYHDINVIEQVYDKIARDFKGKLVITLEHLGSLTKINDDFKIVPSIKVKSIDSTGAGDIYHGAFTHFIAHGYSLLDSMHYANIAGALSVMHVGSKNSMPKYEEVIKHYEL